MSAQLMETIIRAVLPSHSDRLNYVSTRLGPSTFTGPHRSLWDIILSVHELTSGSIIDGPALTRILEAQPEEKLPLSRKIEIEDLWTTLTQRAPITEPDFRVSVEQLLDKTKEDSLGSALVDTARILDVGMKNGQTSLYGVNDAVNYLRESLVSLETRPQDDILEGDVRSEERELLEELTQKNAVPRYPTGIAPIDDMTSGGVGKGELWIVGAYTGVGKSMLALNMAYNFMLDGKNVIYFSLEMPKEQVRNRLLIRHARNKKFGTQGLSLMALNKHKNKLADLTEEQRKLYSTVVHDFTRNPAYGRVPIIQAPRDTRMSTLKAAINRWNDRFPIDVVIIDSLDLVGAETKRASRRDELNEVILAGKHLAMSFGDGGIPVITPWQTSRAAFNNAASEFSEGDYTITALAETSEAERRADLIITMLQKPDTPSRLKIQTLKWRDGQPKDFELKIDYDRCFVGAEATTGGAGSTLDLADY